MRRHRDALLLIDGLVNLFLGILLLLYPASLVFPAGLVAPAGLADAAGLPPFESGFYPTILGAVLFGIGLALCTERYGAGRGVTGLGIAGAIAINLCGGSTLLLWLVFADLAIPVRGRAILWAVAIIVLLIGIVEAASGSWRETGSGRDARRGDRR